MLKSLKTINWGEKVSKVASGFVSLIDGVFSRLGILMEPHNMRKLLSLGASVALAVVVWTLIENSESISKTLFPQKGQSWYFTASIYFLCFAGAWAIIGLLLKSGAGLMGIGSAIMSTWTNTIGLIGRLKTADAKIRLVSLVVVIVSGCTTYIGVTKVGSLASGYFESYWMPILATIAVALMMFIYTLLLLNWIERIGNSEGPVWYKYLALVGSVPVYLVIVMCVSTYWSVICFGGNTTVNYHLTQSVTDAKLTVNSLAADVEAEAKYVPTTYMFGGHFESMANQERNGGYTGYAGEGHIVSKLEGTSVTLNNLGANIESSIQKRRAVLDTLRLAVIRLEEIVSDPDPLNEKKAKFTMQASVVNTLVQRVKAASVASMVTAASSSLSELSMLTEPTGTGNVAEAQRNTIRGIKDAVLQVQSVFAQFTKEITANAVDPTPLAMIEPSQAVLKYWKQIIWAWGTALAMDIFPLFIICVHIIIMSGPVKKQKEVVLNSSVMHPSIIC